MSGGSGGSVGSCFIDFVVRVVQLVCGSLVSWLRWFRGSFGFVASWFLARWFVVPVLLHVLVRGCCFVGLLASFGSWLLLRWSVGFGWFVVVALLIVGSWLVSFGGSLVSVDLLVR